MDLIDSFPVKQQMNKHDCSVCVIWCVLNYYGIKVHYKELYRLVNPPTKEGEGVSGEQISKILKEFGIKTISEESNISRLRFFTDSDYPVIVSIQHRKEYNKAWKRTKKYGHYVVALKISEGKIKYMDPNYGEIHTLSTEDFKNRWHDADDKKIYPNPAIVCISDYYR